jgi:hypothetical protein
MTTVDFITKLLCRVGDEIDNSEKHSQAKLTIFYCPFRFGCDG